MVISSNQLSINISKMNILEAYAILQCAMIVVAVEIESKVMKSEIIKSLCSIAPTQE